MKVGDLVWVYNMSHWGGRRRRERPGTLIKQSYMAYDPGDSYWEVLIDGETKKYRQKVLSLVKEEGKDLYL